MAPFYTIPFDNLMSTLYSGQYLTLINDDGIGDTIVRGEYRCDYEAGYILLDDDTTIELDDYANWRVSGIRATPNGGLKICLDHGFISPEERAYLNVALAPYHTRPDLPLVIQKRLADHAEGNRYELVITYYESAGMETFQLYDRFTLPINPYSEYQFDGLILDEDYSYQELRLFR